MTRPINPLPQHPQGWKFAGRAGEFIVWHAGKNDYRVTRGAAPQVIAQREQFGEAHTCARRLWDTCKAIDAYYTDRNASGQAALTAHR